MEPFIKKLDSTYDSFSGKRRKGWERPLSFFKKWENPIDDPENQIEQVTPQGKKDWKKVGKHRLSRYPKLIPTTKRIYTDKKARSQDTAAAFIKVFPRDVEIVKMDLNRSSLHKSYTKSAKHFRKSLAMRR